jgi:hypothetical protein
MIALTVIVCASVLLAGLIAMLVAASSAPLGYEDGHGFFEGVGHRLPEIPMTGEITFLDPEDLTLMGDDDGLGFFEDVEPWRQERPEMAEPVLSAHGASSPLHGVQ